MNIFVLVHLFPARSETFVREHIVGMACRGHRLTVIARELDEKISQKELCEIDQRNITRIYINQAQSRFIKFIKIVRALLERPKCYYLFRNSEPWKRSQLLLALDVAKYIKIMKPDFVHVHFGDLAARLNKVSPYVGGLPPMLVTWHGYDANAVPGFVGNDVYHDLFQSNYLHTVGSRFMYQRLLALGAKERQISIIPMGIDLDKFQYQERVIEKKRPLRILSVGRLDEMKGHCFLIQAIKILLERNVYTQLIIVGDGVLKENLRQQIESSCLNNYVTMLGALPSDQVVHEMHLADLFVLSGIIAKNGKVEAQGVVFAEAQATGLPVIACNVGGVSESVLDGKSGILCAPGDSIALANAIAFFDKNREAIKIFGKEGRRLVEKKFSHMSMLKSFESIYGRF